MKKLVYTCPFCKDVQNSIIQWQTVSIAYEYNFSTKKWNEVDREGGDHEAWACPECSEDLPNKLVENLEMPF